MPSVPPLRTTAALLLVASALAGAGAEGNVVVDQTSLSATVGTGAIAAIELTVRNTGAGPLRMRLRDTGSGTGGTPEPKGTLATYAIEDWYQKRRCSFIAFDGLSLWQYNNALRVTRLEVAFFSGPSCRWISSSARR
jgi:hypothetical protein